MALSFRQLAGIPLSTASTKDSVLVIIDAQNEYAEGPLTTANVSSTRKVISTLLEKYRAASAPLVHILHETGPGAPVFAPGSEGIKEFAELEPKSGEKVIVKHYPGSFTGTDLEEYLTSTGIKKIVLTGYMAHVCVSTTARQADEKGYDVVLAEGAIGDRDIPGATAAELVSICLAELADSFGSVVSAASIN